MLRGKHIVGAALWWSLTACGAQQVASTTPEPAIAQGGELRVLIEDSSLVLIEGSSNTPLVIYFDVDSDVIEPRLHQALDALAVFLLSHDHLHVDVQGHADERGSDVYNERLSLRRANAVKRYLVAHGVEPAQLSAMGFGEQRPLPGRDDPSHRQHRRVEFVAGTTNQLSAAATH